MWEFKGTARCLFPDWQGLPPRQYLAIFGQGNTYNTRNKLPVAFFHLGRFPRPHQDLFVCAHKRNSNVIFCYPSSKQSCKSIKAIQWIAFCWLLAGLISHPAWCGLSACTSWIISCADRAAWAISLQSTVFCFAFCCCYFTRETASARGCFSAVPCHTITICPSLTAGWLGLGYISCPRKHSSSRTWNLAITRPMPRPLSYYC